MKESSSVLAAIIRAIEEGGEWIDDETGERMGLDDLGELYKQLEPLGFNIQLLKEMSSEEVK